MVISVPTGALVGLKEVIVGGGVTLTVKAVLETTVPPGATIVMGAVVAPVGTVATICWVLRSANCAGTSPN